jgi:tetratricopeptide (TPR) repeat protein
LVLISALSALLSAAPRFASAQSHDSASDVVQLLRSRQYEAAEQAAQRLLAETPHDCRLLSLRGLALNGMEKAAEAKRSFEEALQSCPNDLLALEGAAQIAYAQKQPDAAALLERILALRQDDGTSHAMLASLYRAHRDCRAALPHFEASRSLFASHPQLQEGYAFCLASTGDDARAAANYQELLESHPNDTARYNLAVVQGKLHNPTAALQTLQPLLTSGSAEAPLELGSQLAEEAGQTPEAVQLLRTAILRQPGNADNYLRFAQLSFTHNSYQVGIDMLNAGLTQLANAGSLYLARGVLEVQLSQFDKAIADFQKAHRLEPQLSLAMDAIGIMQSQQHLSDASLKLFEQQAKMHPSDSLLQYLYAEALSEATTENDALPRAIAAAERSVKIEPGYQPAHDLLALLYLRAGQPAQAAQQAEVARKIDPADETALYQEIMAKRRLGQTAEVQRLVRQLAELQKTNTDQQRQRKGYVLKDEVPQ